MRCHYEVLEIDRSADDDTIKKAYRRLALKWHPDKNPEDVEECTRYFSLIQQAYDVLSDPNERAWYDRHRESILKGGIDEHYEDNSLNLFPYFTTTCYNGYGDDDKSFYGVYRQVFETLAVEDYEFLDGKPQAYPGFGNQNSIYEDIVGPFYAFWGSFCTVRSFAWVESFNIRQAANRRVVRAMEKENKKLREAAKRERNEEIRALVAFIRKRDPRVEAHKKVLAKRRLEQERKTEENRKQKILERLSQVGEYKELEEVRQSQLENLREIEEALDAEFGCSSDESGSELSEDMELYCIFCEKTFKTEKALKNHEKSKKHKDMVALLRKHVQEDDSYLLMNEKKDDGNEELDKMQENNAGKKKSKRQKRKERKKNEYDTEKEDDDNDGEELNQMKNDTSREPVGSGAELDSGECEAKADETDISLEMSNEVPQSSKARRKKEKERTAESNAAQSTTPKTGKCDRCGEFFESRTKLFAHLKEFGHATLKAPQPTTSTRTKINKIRKK